MGWAANRHRWRQELADTHTYARLYLLTEEFRNLTESAREVCRHHMLALVSPKWHAFVPRVGEQWHYVGAMHTVAKCRDVQSPVDVCNSPFHSPK